MTNSEKIALLEEIMELDEGTLSEDSILDDFEEWDSLSKLSLVALAKSKFNKKMGTEDIKSFQSVGDICNWL